MSHAEDEEHTTFLRLSGFDDGTGEAPVVSRAAFRLHSFGTVSSVRSGHPGFVPDDYLNAIGTETTVTVAELCTAGMWSRVDGGYEVVKRQMVDMLVDQARQREQDRKTCRETGGHEPDEEYPKYCRKCDDKIT